MPSATFLTKVSCFWVNGLCCFEAGEYNKTAICTLTEMIHDGRVARERCQNLCDAIRKKRFQPDVENVGELSKSHARWMKFTRWASTAFFWCSGNLFGVEAFNSHP